MARLSTEREREIRHGASGNGFVLGTWVDAVNDLLAELDALRADYEAMRERQEKAEALLNDVADAMLWATGAPAFAPEGEAREGFERLYKPVLDRVMEHPRG